MPRCQRVSAVCLLVLSALAAPSRAQTTPPQPSIESMPLHFGPLGLAPSLAITDVGVDSNVFNDAENPQEDFSATFVPKLLARFRMRRLFVSYATSTDLVYFHDIESERSTNVTNDVTLDADLGRFQPFIQAGWLSTKQRLNSELDLRAPRSQQNVGGGARLLVASRTTLVFTARRRWLDFDEDVFFRGVELAHTLNSRTDSGAAAVQVALTPLTTFALTTSVQQDRFTQSPERNADTLRVVPSLQFDPTSLIRGSVAVGYRRFRPDSPAIPDYSGVLVQAGLSYTIRDRTRIDLDLQRDVHYSFEETEPYYLSTGGRLTVRQQIVGNVDVQVLGGRQGLSYRSTATLGESRHDTADIVGAGIGYHLRDDVRLGLNWEFTQRHSPVRAYQYERRRIFASLTIGS
jgi:hypothetical protein